MTFFSNRLRNAILIGILSLITIGSALLIIALSSSPSLSPCKITQSPKSVKRHGRGIVIAAGGRYMTCAISNVIGLRDMGCTLPIAIVYGDDSEFFDKTDQLLVNSLCRKLNLSFVNASVEFAKAYPELPCINFKGYQLKPFAMLFSPYKQAMLLDADVISLTDPTFLFDEEAFTKTGALFWPDVVGPEVTRYLKPALWKKLNITPPKDRFQQESSCVILDLNRQMKSLLVTCSLNYDYRNTYKYCHGDKDLWRAGCLYSNLPYQFIQSCGTIVFKNGRKNFLQYAPDGSLLYVQGEDVRGVKQCKGFIRNPKWKIRFNGDTDYHLDSDKIEPLNSDMLQKIQNFQKRLEKSGSKINGVCHILHDHN